MNLTLETFKKWVGEIEKTNEELPKTKLTLPLTTGEAREIITQIQSLITTIESQKEEIKRLTKRITPDLCDLTEFHYLKLKMMWATHGSWYLISVLRYLDYLNNIPDIFSPERYSPNSVQEGVSE